MKLDSKAFKKAFLDRDVQVSLGTPFVHSFSVLLFSFCCVVIVEALRQFLRFIYCTPVRLQYVIGMLCLQASLSF
jgi:hypothetical protein